MVSHPLFGKVRQVEEPWVGSDGRTGSTWLYDADYRPKIPTGAVRGDLSKQVFCHLCHAPHFYYVDEDKQCVECGNSFVFSAEEQKYWFEELQFNFHSTAIRCVDCRRSRRRQAAANAALGEATQAVQRHPDDADVLLAFARATSAHFQRSGRGRLDLAIGACRRARALKPELREGWYWEAMCQEHAGRGLRALEAYESFVAAAKPSPAELPLVALSKERIAVLRETDSLEGGAL